MSIVRCKAVSVRLARNFTTDVVPVEGDEENLVREAVIEDEGPRPMVENKRTEVSDGIAVLLRNIQNGNEYERFFSENEIREVAGIGRRLTDDEMMIFGEVLVARKTPITIGVFDKEVSLEGVSVNHEEVNSMMSPQIMIKE